MKRRVLLGLLLVVVIVAGLLAIIADPLGPIPNPRPTEVKINGEMWSITYGTTIPQNLGETICDRNEIRIADHLSRSKEQEVVLHELSHTSFCAFDGVLAVAGTNPAAFPYNQEGAIRFIAPQLVSILHENPTLLAYLSR